MTPAEGRQAALQQQKDDAAKTHAVILPPIRRFHPEPSHSFPTSLPSFCRISSVSAFHTRFFPQANSARILLSEPECPICRCCQTRNMIHFCQFCYAQIVPLSTRSLTAQQRRICMPSDAKPVKLGPAGPRQKIKCLHAAGRLDDHHVASKAQTQSHTSMHQSST